MKLSRKHRDEPASVPPSGDKRMKKRKILPLGTPEEVLGVDVADRTEVQQKKVKKLEHGSESEAKEDEKTENLVDGSYVKQGEGEKLIPLQKAKKRHSAELPNLENGRKYTVSIAVAGSIVDNAQSLELATSLAGQIGRAAAVFQVDEIVVFDEGDEASGPGKQRRWRDKDNESGGVFLARILQYLDTPQYLRQALIPMHADLRFAGRLPPLDAPHHARAHEWPLYREGCVVSNPGGSGDGVKKKKSKNFEGSFVNVGLLKEVQIRQQLEVGTRVTVSMGSDREAALAAGAVLQAVSPSEPREKVGAYWGYTVRLVQGVGRIFSDSPFEGGYDYIMGTSEHGEKLRSADLQLPPFRHLLIVFGGVAGLEESVELDGQIEVKDTPSLFHRYLNTCPGQGSRTIRTEEAILISMSFLQDAIWRSTGNRPF